MAERLYIRKCKRPEGSGSWGVYLTAQDQFGYWLFTPRGSTYLDERRGEVFSCYVGKPGWPGMPVIHLVRPDAWWIATFAPPDEACWSPTFDMCCPPKLVNQTWIYEDLELDLLVDCKSGQLVAEDEDEFTEAVKNKTISETEETAVRFAARELGSLASDRRRNFSDAGARRLGEALELALDPITDLTDS